MDNKENKTEKKTVDKAAKPAEKKASKPAAKSTEKKASKPAEKSAEKKPAKSAEKKTAKSSAKTTAKKTTKKKTSKKPSKVKMLETLPQNILPIGEQVTENKKIYISQSVYKEIHRFTENKTTNESGGILVGNVIEEFGKTNIVIQGFVEAKYTQATPTTLKFTHETWEYVHSVIEKRYENGNIVGWIHTHPDFGIFLSEYDMFIQENFFRDENQLAYVVDPIQNIEGFYFWINDKIERCKGFYIYDKTGEKIDIKDLKNDAKKPAEAAAERTPAGKPYLTMTIIGILVLIILVFAAICVNLMNRISALEQQQDQIIQAVNSVYQQLDTNINDLQSKVDSYHPTEADEEAEGEGDGEEIKEGEEGSQDNNSANNNASKTDGNSSEGV